MQALPILDLIAHRIRAVRGERSMTREELSVAAGVSLRTLSRIEAGEDHKVTTLHQIARALDVPVGNLTTAA
jgi:transcriptional regulator with XRE-family HTH domain